MAALGSVNAVTGLTLQQVGLVQTTWALLANDLMTSGAAILLSLLDTHPEYQSVFTPFKDVPRDQLPDNENFKNHALTVATALNTVIENLSNTDRLVTFLEDLGTKHTKHGVTKEMINKVNPVVIGVLQKKVGKDFTKEAEEAWLKTLEKAWSIMFPNTS